jgi:PAS domain S-box-containing protein
MHLRHVQRLTAADLRQQKLAAQLQVLVRAKLAELKQTLEVRRKNGAPASQRIVASDRGLFLMNDIRGIVSTMKKVENQILDVRSAQSDASAHDLLWTIGLSNSLACLLLFSLAHTALRDIKVRRHAQEEQEKLVTILEATTDFVGIADVQGRILYINHSGLEMIGKKSGDETIGTPIIDYSPPWANEILGNEAIPTALREGSWSGETALLNHNGEEIPVSQVVLCHKNAEGVVQYLSTVARDISERKEYEQQIEEQQRQLHLANEKLQTQANTDS